MYRYWTSHKKLFTTLCIIGAGGVFGVFIDFDHIPYIFGLQGEPRAAHIQIAFTLCIVLIGIIAYMSGLYIRLVLRRKRNG
jgi:hypothetical protein